MTTTWTTSMSNLIEIVSLRDWKAMGCPEGWVIKTDLGVYPARYVTNDWQLVSGSDRFRTRTWHCTPQTELRRLCQRVPNEAEGIEVEVAKHA